LRRFASFGALIATLPLLTLGPRDQVAPTQWAVLVGISDYINLEDYEGGDLHAGAGDARLIRDALVMKLGVPEENIRLLVDHDATRAAIQEAITGWLAGNVRPDDKVFIYFAGHGSQMWDENGDEDDGLDETLAPADVVLESTEFDISDDTFNQWLSTLRTSPEDIRVVLDNCSSGTGTRDVTPFSRGRLLARDLDGIERPATATRRALPGQQQDETGFDAVGVEVLELSAAQPGQVAVETFFPGSEGAESFYGGAFTTFFVQQIWKAPTDATYQDVFDATYEALKRNRFQQDPYISDDATLRAQPVFAANSAATDMVLPVTRVSGDRAELAAGLALGITPGSVFETTSGATLRVESVTQRATSARVTNGRVRQGDEARLAAFHFVTSPLLVNVAAIDTRLVEGLRSQLSGAPDIRLVEDENAFSHLIVRRGGDELRVVGSDGFARHTEIGVGASGISELAETLRKEAASKRLGDMDNPAQSFGVRLELLGGKTSFGLGERINFSVLSERDGYLTLVDLGTDGTVTVLLPNEDHTSMPLRANQRMTYPQEAGVFFQAQPPAGGGLVRAFVTAEPLAVEIPQGAPAAIGGVELAEDITNSLMSTAGMADGAVRLDTWGTASIVYDIHN
jgi:hypothetical protein